MYGKYLEKFVISTKWYMKNWKHIHIFLDWSSPDSSVFFYLSSPMNYRRSLFFDGILPTLMPYSSKIHIVNFANCLFTVGILIQNSCEFCDGWYISLNSSESRWKIRKKNEIRISVKNQHPFKIFSKYLILSKKRTLYSLPCNMTWMENFCRI